MIMRTVQAPAQNHIEKLCARVRVMCMKSLVAKLWLGIREWCGDSAYERYLQAQKKKPEKSGPLTPAQFYVERVNRRYSRPNRCC
jgi:uncharacterized short protein YbdD (DUF466 family)